MISTLKEGLVFKLMKTYDKVAVDYLNVIKVLFHHPVVNFVLTMLQINLQSDQYINHPHCQHKPFCNEIPASGHVTNGSINDNTIFTFGATGYYQNIFHHMTSCSIYLT